MNERTLARILLGIVVTIAVAAFLTIILGAIDGMTCHLVNEIQKIMNQDELNKTIWVMK